MLHAFAANMLMNYSKNNYVNKVIKKYVDIYKNYANFSDALEHVFPALFFAAFSEVCNNRCPKVARGTGAAC